MPLLCDYKVYPQEIPSRMAIFERLYPLDPSSIFAG